RRQARPRSRRHPAFAFRRSAPIKPQNPLAGKSPLREYPPVSDRICRAMASRQDTSGNRLDDAARAGWLYYVAGNNQEEIARKLSVSRQTAQRLVSLSVSEGLIKVRLDHPIGRCMELAEKLRQRFALDLSEVVPSDAE